MIIDNYYSYLILMAFEYLYKYENIRSISVERLNLFRIQLLEEVLDIYENGKGHNYLQESDQWKGEVYFEEIDENNSLKEFLEEFEEYFYLDNNTVYLYETISFEELSKLVRQVKARENISSRFNIVDCSKELRDILGISTFDEIIDRYSKFEEKLQNFYYKLFTSKDSKDLRTKIKSLLFYRRKFFEQVSKMPDYRVDAIRMAASNYVDENDTNLYDKYPIDLNMWKMEYENPDDFLSDIDDRVYHITQYAIFGKEKNVLYLEKIYEDLNEFYFFEGVETSEEIDIDYAETTEIDNFDEDFEYDVTQNSENFVTLYDPSDEFFVFYINYLNNLDNFMSIYGESRELLFAKKRLLYALDKPTFMLYDEDKFKIAYEESKSIELDEEPFDFFVDEFYFMAQEVFRVPCDEYTIRKLLLVGTYYNLTKDQEVKTIIERFNNDPRFTFFYEVMINNCTSKVPENLSEDIQKLILKLVDRNKPKD